ncbi:hypothetical protein BDV23DRAFT_116016 [Aspergillus alliaceus]|uniref:AB hydrolase-1 domain-containing protein n=1 Tax=Petromyces alliaceus TaxID=209559 RepID=A0A5N7CMW2_PETAA|nr:hypothetical protein BDV23DRAFT_116016 [Aspergillus alliaceus]
MPPSNTSLYDMVSHAPNAPFHHPDSNGWEIFDNANPIDLFYNDLTVEVTTSWVAKLRRQSYATLTERENAYSGWLDVPVWYLLCTRDQAIPILAPEAMVAAAKEAGASVETQYLDSGHVPFLDKADETPDFIQRALESFR